MPNRGNVREEEFLLAQGLKVQFIVAMAREDRAVRVTLTEAAGARGSCSHGHHTAGPPSASASLVCSGIGW